MKKLYLLAMAMMVLAANAAIGATINVPSDYPTIQAAIDAAANSDIVEVEDGTYTGEGNRNIDFKGKAITLKSKNGPEKCIIDCEKQATGILFINGEKSNSVLSGFTITNGISKNAGGIYCYYSSPTISNCIITGNEHTYNSNPNGGGDSLCAIFTYY